MNGFVLPAREGPIRVLHLTAVSTSNYYLNNLVDYSDPQSVAFGMATLAGRGSFTDDLQRRGVATFPLAASSRLQYPRALRRISTIIRKERIEVIHSHLFDPSLLGGWAASRHRLPHVLTRHHSDALHRLQPLARRKLYLAIEGWVTRRASRIIAPARMVRDVLQEIEGISPSRVAILPYPQAPGRFDAVTADSVRRVRATLEMEGHVALVYVARLHPEKGHAVLLDALSQLVPQFPGIRLYLVGEGGLRPGLEETTSRRGLNAHVRFLGWREDALAVLAAADLVVHPSLHEALPSAVIEAVVLGRPVVASDVSGVRDILNDGEFGAIVPPANVDALQATIARVLRELPAARRRAEGGRRFVLEYMEPGRVAEAHLACYLEAVTEARNGNNRSS